MGALIDGPPVTDDDGDVPGLTVAASGTGGAVDCKKRTETYMYTESHKSYKMSYIKSIYEQCYMYMYIYINL